MSNLPDFFKSSGTTVLDELANFELGGGDDLDGLIDEGNPGELVDEMVMDDDAFDIEGFGDLKEENLPEFFATPKKSGSATPVNDIASFDMLSLTPSASTKAVRASPVPGPPPGLMSTSKAPPNTPANDLMTLLRNASEKLPPAPQTPSVLPKPSVESSQSSTSDVPLTPSFATLASAQSLSKPFQEAPAKANYGHGKYMSYSDVRFITHKVLQPLMSNDPYSDDFYFLQYNMRKNLKEREQAAKENTIPPPTLHVPLPAWKDTKDRIKQQMDQSRQGFEDKVKEWEVKEQVLGHRLRSQVNRPRELLTLQSVHDMDFDLDNDLDMNEGADFKAPFSSRLWTTRLAVQQGFEALFTAQELQHLMSNPAVTSSALAVQEVRAEMTSALALLSQSLGIRQTSSLTAFSPFSSPAAVDASSSSSASQLTLDGRHIAAIMQTNMGKKLLTRALALLPPQQRSALLPIVLARIMSSPISASASVVVTPSTNTSSSNAAANAALQAAAQQEAVFVERKLLKTIIEFLQFSYQHHIVSNSQVYTDELLSNLRQCLKNVMITLMNNNSLRDSVLSERTRAEVLNVIVEVGDQIQSSASSVVADEWEQSREAFMSILEY